MDKEAELLINKYLKKVRNSLADLPAKDLKDRIETIRAHILDAIEDQKNNLSEVDIAKNAIKELGFPKTQNILKERLIEYSVLIVVGVFLIIGDIFYIHKNFGYTTSIPYFLIIFTGEGGFDLWKFLLQNRMLDKRFDLIYAWIFFPILLIELWLVEIFFGLPIVGNINIVQLIVVIVYGILLIFFTVMMIVAPGELLEKKCPNCHQLIPFESKFCLRCGEELE